VFVNRIKGRGLRLGWTHGIWAALLALALPGAAFAAAGIATQTALNIETRDQGGQTQATASVTVTGSDGLPVAGTVSVEDGTRQLAEAVLDSDGQATVAVTLTSGEHALRAVY